MQVKINKQIIALFQNSSLISKSDEQLANDEQFLDNLISHFKTQYNGSGTKIKFKEYIKKTVKTLTEVLDKDEVTVDEDMLILSEHIFDQTYTK